MDATNKTSLLHEAAGDLGLGVLSPPERNLLIGDVEIILKPANLLTLAKMVRAVDGLLAHLGGLAPESSITTALLPALVDPRYVEGLLQVASLGSGRERAWIDGLEPDEQLRLIVAVIEVNIDFFAQRLRPALTEGVVRLMTRLVAGRGSVGQT
jgi:hypothetical protein